MLFVLLGRRVAALRAVGTLLFAALAVSAALILLPGQAYAVEDGADAANTGQTDYVKYGPVQAFKTFNIQGVDEGRIFKTTFVDRGYSTYARVQGTGDAAKVTVPPDGSPTSIGNGLTAWITLDDTYNGRYVRITYHVKNQGASSAAFQIGSCADVMIDNNDLAPVAGASGGLTMSGAPKNDYSFNLLAPTASTLWYGFYSSAKTNVFTDLPDKSVPYSGDSGMAWSFSGTVASGAEWTQAALIGVGEFPDAPEAPAFNEVGTIAVGEENVISGTGQPGTTVTVNVAGQSADAVVGEDGRWQASITVPGSYVVTGDEKLVGWATSEEGGISEVVSQDATVALRPLIELSASSTTVMEDFVAGDEWYRGFVRKSVGAVSYGPELDPGVLGTQTITYRAQSGGEEASATLEVTVLPMPLSLSQAVASDAGSGSFSLSSTLEGIGGLDIVETGFVYGAMQQPTLAVNDGVVATEAPVTVKGGVLQASATDIVGGLQYRARAYAKASDGTVVYGPQSNVFGIGIPSYGAFGVASNGDGTFTVTRTGGTDGAQSVYWRTSSGSAVAGTHFESSAGKLDFAVGEASKTFTVTEYGATQAFNGAAQTAYANADRTYFAEIYRVDGGATVDQDAARATRTMSVDGAHEVNRGIFDGSSWLESTPSGEQMRGDYDVDGLGWTDGNQVGSAASVDFDPASLLGARGYWNNVSQSIRYYASLQAKERDDGYQHVTISENGLNTSIYPWNGTWYGNDTRKEVTALRSHDPVYAGLFRHGGNGTNKSYATYYFPGAGKNPAEAKTWNLFRPGQDANASYVAFDPSSVNSITLGFCASGSGADRWYTNSIVHHIQLVDGKEPSILGVVADRGAAYRPGDSFTVSVVFDEIVDARNSALDGMRLATTWGDAQYEGGADTNVLYFTGTVPQGVAQDLSVAANALSAPGNVKDMAGNTCNTNVSAGGIIADISKMPAPSVSVGQIENANGTLSAAVTAENAMRVDYAWTNSADSPSSGWMAFEGAEGGQTRTRQVSGTWYLHAHAVNADGVEATACSAPVELGDPSSSGGEPTVQLPDLAAHADGSGWVRECEITLDKSPEDATVTVKKPDGSSADVPGASYIADANGVYTFTLSSDGESVTAQATVSNIDRDDPDVSIDGPAGGTYADVATLTVRASDATSNVESVEGVWHPVGLGAEQRAVLSPIDGQPGTYECTTPGEGSWRLSVEAVDAAGNTGRAESAEYTLDLRAPAITVHKDDAASSPQGAVYRYEVAPGASPIVSVQLPDGTATVETSGTFTITAPGTYYVVAADQAGHVVYSDPIELESTPESPLDGVAPDVRLVDTTVIEDGGLNPPLEAVVKVSVFEETETGDTITATLAGDGALAAGIAGNLVLSRSADVPGLYEGEIAATASGVYAVGFADAAGNEGEGSINIVLHEHDYAYTAEGSVVTETCKNGCGHSATATLSVPEAQRVYTGEAYTPATVSYDEAWVGERPDIVYADNIDAGTATATLSVGQASATTTFDISPASLEDVDVKQSGELSYTGKAQTAHIEAAASAVNDQPISFEYRIAGSSDAWSKSVPAFTDAGQHAVSYRVSAPNHASQEGEFSIAIDPAALSVRADDVQTVYGDAAPDTFTVSAEGWIGDEGARLFGDLIQALSFSCGYVQGSPVVEGGYPVSVSWKDEAQGAPSVLANYDIDLAGATLTVDPLVADLVWEGVQERVFADGGRATAHVANRFGDDDVAVEVEGGDAADAGVHTARATALVGEDAGNYLLPDESACSCTYAIAQSQGAVHADSYGDGGEAKDAFTYGDTVTVRATVSATGEAADAADAGDGAHGARMYLDGAVQPGQMALFYQDAAGERHRISDPVSPDGEGVYAMTYDTSSRMVPALGSTVLIAAFAATEDVADAEAYVSVSVDRRPLSVQIAGNATKSYDGSVSADGIGLGLALSGAVEGDEPTATAARYEFNSANVKEATTVCAYGIELDGDSAPWYTVDAQASAEGSITKAVPAPPTATVLPEATEGGNDGALTDLGEGVQWRPAGSDEWLEVPEGGTVSGLAPGEYEIRTAGDDNHEDSEPATVVVESFSEAHGGMTFPDGTTDDGKGSAVLPDGGGTVILPGGSEVTLPGGSVVAPDGSVVTPGGVVVRPGDEDGAIDVTFPDGSEATVPEDSTVTDEGEVVLPGGQIVVKPDGQGNVDVVLPDGSHIVAPSGSEVRADGSVIGPDGHPVLPVGSDSGLAKSGDNAPIAVLAATAIAAIAIGLVCVLRIATRGTSGQRGAHRR